MVVVEVAVEVVVVVVVVVDELACGTITQPLSCRLTGVAKTDGISAAAMMVEVFLECILKIVL